MVKQYYYLIDGIPKMHWYGIHKDHNVMVMDLLGPDLEKLLSDSGYVFPMKTVLLIALQTVS